jgi:hypothetical protein
MGHKDEQDAKGPVEETASEQVTAEDTPAEPRQRGAPLGAMEGMPGAQVIARVGAVLLSIRERVRDAIADGREGAAESEAEARVRFEVMTRRRRPKSRA